MAYLCVGNGKLKKIFNLKDLALRLGKSEAEISKWMRGTHNFTIDTLVSIEDALDATIVEVYHSPGHQGLVHVERCKMSEG